jgi:flagellar biosynthesis/type III secretory pathway M-ring protein FliF/YscJ
LNPVQRDAVWQFSTWIVVACLILMVAAIILFVVIAWYRRRWLESGASSQGEAWTLDDLQRLRDQGAMSEQEYLAARAVMIEGFRGKGSEGRKVDSSPEKPV